MTQSLRLALLAALLGAAPLRAVDLVVTVTNRPGAGPAVALLFDSPTAFADLANPVRSEPVPGEGPGRVTFSGLPPGDYAVVVYQDGNGNGRLDKNFIGIPREPLGFSNRYRPQGPPSFARAAFRLEEGTPREEEVELRFLLGRRGRVGVGAGVLAQSSPYAGADGAVLQPIPVMTYVGDRLQVFGPRAQVGLIRQGDSALAATASYRLGAYEDDDSDRLEGLGDREGTLMGGLAVRARAAGLRWSAGYEHDLLDESGGGIARAGAERTCQRGLWTWSPQVALNWMSDELAAYEFGVPSDRARADRPAYRPGDAFIPEAGLGVFVELPGEWRLMLNGSVKFLPSEITDSPIVDEHQIVGGFAAFTRLF